MKVVRKATPGTRSRMRLSSASYFCRVPGRFMRFSTGFDACCSGRSMYLQTFSHSAIAASVSSSMVVG